MANQLFNYLNILRLGLDTNKKYIKSPNIMILLYVVYLEQESDAGWLFVIHMIWYKLTKNLIFNKLDFLIGLFRCWVWILVLSRVNGHHLSKKSWLNMSM